MAQRVGRDIALLFHNRGTKRGWMVNSTPRPHFTPGKDPVPIVQEAGWAPGPVWTGGKSRTHRDSIPDHPARSQSLYRLSYPANRRTSVSNLFYFGITLHMFRTVFPSIIRSSSLYIQQPNRYCCLLAGGAGSYPLPSKQQYLFDTCLLLLYSLELLMMDGKTVRNM